MIARRDQRPVDDPRLAPVIPRMTGGEGLRAVASSSKRSGAPWTSRSRSRHRARAWSGSCGAPHTRRVRAGRAAVPTVDHDEARPPAAQRSSRAAIGHRGEDERRAVRCHGAGVGRIGGGVREAATRSEQAAAVGAAARGRHQRPAPGARHARSGALRPHRGDVRRRVSDPPRGPAHRSQPDCSIWSAGAIRTPTEAGATRRTCSF